MEHHQERRELSSRFTFLPCDQFSAPAHPTSPARRSRQLHGHSRAGENRRTQENRLTTGGYQQFKLRFADSALGTHDDPRGTARNIYASKPRLGALVADKDSRCRFSWIPALVSQLLRCRKGADLRQECLPGLLHGGTGYLLPLGHALIGLRPRPSHDRTIGLPRHDAEHANLNTRIRWPIRSRPPLASA